MNFKNMTDDELLESTKQAVQEETNATIKIVRHLREIYRRKVYAARGYSSLYEMCIEYFKYSEGATQRRTSAMWLINDAPEFEQKIQTGELNLTLAAQIQTFCRANDKDVREVGAKVIGKSTREAKREFLKIVPEPVPKEKARAVTEDHTAITIVVNNEELAVLDELRNLRSHVNPDMSYKELLMQLVALGQKKWSRKRRKAASSPMSKAEERRVVFENADEQCEYIDPLTGRRCESKRLLEVEHVDPLGLGGADILENKCVFCRTHNHYSAIQKFGAQKLRNYIRF